MNRAIIIVAAAFWFAVAPAFGQQAGTQLDGAHDFVIAGQCLSRGDFNKPIPAVELRLFAVKGLLQQSEEIASSVSNERKLPVGRKLDIVDLLHYDPATEQHVPQRGSTFLYVTREEGLGVITITDFVTEVRDLTGGFGAPPRGVGFNRGVRFDYRTIAR